MNTSFHGPHDAEDTTREPRLFRQVDAVRQLMSDERWRTLGEIREWTGGSEASISARLRDLRKRPFGGYQVERRHVRGGLYQYRLLLPVPSVIGRLF